MRGRLISLALLGALSVGTQALAQEALPLGQSTSSVVLIDTDELFRRTLMGKRISAEFETRARDLQAENERITTALTAEEKSLTERRPTMDPVAFRKEAAEFDTRVQGIRRARDAAIASFEAEGAVNDTVCAAVTFINNYKLFIFCGYNIFVSSCNFVIKTSNFKSSFGG